MRAGIFFIALLMLPCAAFAELKVTDAWVTLPVAGVENAAGYMQLSNTGHEPLQVVAVHCEMAMHCHLHQVLHDQGIVRMKGVSTIEVLPGTTVKLVPGDLHVMVMGISDEFRDAKTMPIELETQTGLRVSVELQIGGIVALEREGGRP